jgi:hypothetical protein
MIAFPVVGDPTAAPADLLGADGEDEPRPGED